MPDPIGELDVIIGGDFSALSDAIDQAQKEAAQGASAIADAFSVPTLGDAMVQSLEDVGSAATAASGQVTSFGDNAQGAVDSLNSLGDAASGAGGDIGGAGDAAGAAAGGMDNLGSSAGAAAGEVAHVGESAQEAEGGLSAMAEQLTAIGEALIITEGLKEFGQEALTAAGTVQTVTIGLTALTGSAEKADEIVTQIKELAATEPFAFPEIAPTVQKMIAMGVSADQINATMRALADVSAATGNSFEAVAQRLDMMSLSGIANARSMNALALNLPQLGAAMNSLGFAAGDTGKEITEAFKALPDQASRIAVLDAALSKFAGTAEAEAQGIAGQWTIFQNQFEEVMVAVGNALTPAVSDILTFGKSVLSGVQGAVEVFNALPGPVKEVVGVLGILVGAAIPVATGLAAIGIGLQGLNQLIPQATALWATLTGAEVTETASTTANAAAHTTAAAAVATANTEIAESSAAAATGLTAEATAAGVANEQLSLFASEGAFVAGEQLGLFTTAELDAAAAAATTGTAMISLAGAVTSLAAIVGGFTWGFLSANAEVNVTDKLNAMTGFAHDLGVSLSFMSDASGNASGAINKLQTILSTAGVDISALTEKFKSGVIDQNQYVLALLDTVKAQVGVQGAVDGTSASYAKFIGEQQKLADAVANAKDNLIQAKIDLDNGTISTNTYAAAQAALTRAQDALTNSTKAHSSASDKDKESYTAVTAEAAKLIATNIEAQTTYNKLADSQDGSEKKAVALQIAYDNLAKSTDALNKYQQTQVTQSDAVATATQAIYDKVIQANQALQTAIQVYNGIRQATIDGTASQAAYNDAWNNLLTAFKNANPEMATAKGNIADVGAAAMKAAQADDSWTGSHGNLITVIKSGVTTQVQVADAAQKMADGATAAATAGTSLGVAWSLMDVKIADGTGTVNNVVQALTDLDAKALNATASVGALGPVLTNTGKDFADAQGNLQSFLGGLNDLVSVTPTATDDIANLDVSMVKVDKDTIDASTAVQQFGQSVNDSKGNVVSLTDLLKELATQWEDVAKAATDAASAQDSAANSGSSSGGKAGSSKGGGGTPIYVDPTTPQGAALQQFFNAINGPFANGGGMAGMYEGLGSSQNSSSYSQGLSSVGPYVFGDGGIVTGPTLGILGESGPEAVIPLGDISSAIMVQAQSAPAPLSLSNIGGLATPSHTDPNVSTPPVSSSLPSSSSAPPAQVGPVWSGPQYDPNTGVVGSSTYVVSGSGTTADPFKWVPSGGINAGTTFTAGPTASGDVPLGGAAVGAPGAGPVWSGPKYNPATGEPGTPTYVVSGSGTTADPFKWVPSGGIYAGATSTPSNPYAAPGGGNYTPFNPGAPTGTAGGPSAPALDNLASQIEALGGTLLGLTAGNQIVTSGGDITKIAAAYQAWLAAGEPTAQGGASYVPPGAAPIGYGYGGPTTQPTLTAAQLQALLNNPGPGDGSVPGKATPANLQMTININNPQMSNSQSVENVGTQLINTIRQNASALKFSWQ